MSELINANYKIKKLELHKLIDKLDSLSVDLGDKESRNDLKKLISSLDKPFMFVVIGEVKAGKSSFINALLDTPNLCKVDVDICTDKVSQLIFSEDEYEELVGENLIEKGVNKDILKEISIVDTPGTDSIVEDHEVITKSFAPESDLIIFVFPIFNPHHRSAWQMLDYMNNDWKKNIVFVCQQADRMTEKEIEINAGRIKQYAIERGISEPKVFITSAKNALESRDKGIDSLKDFISSHVTDGEHMKHKLRDKVKSCEIVRDRLDKELDNRRSILQKDLNLRQNIKSRFKSGEKRSLIEMENIIGRLLRIYYYKVKIYTHQLEELLSTPNLFKQMIPGVKKEKLNKNSLEEFSKRMKDDIEKELEVEAHKNANHFIEGVKDIFNNIIQDISKEIENLNKDKVYDNFYKKREEIFISAKERLEELANEENFIEILSSHTPNVNSIAIKGGSLTVAGALLAIFTQNAYLDITGGIMAALGILGTTITIMFKRSKTLKEFKGGLNKAGDTFESNLKIQFENSLTILYEQIERTFTNLDAHIDAESKKLEPLENKIEGINKHIVKFRNDLQK